MDKTGINQSQKFIQFYSNEFKNKQEGDIIKFPPIVKPCDVRFNRYMYSNDNSDVFHFAKYFDRTGLSTFFYLDNYKKLNIENFHTLPFNTKHQITKEVIGYSIYTTCRNGNRYVYSKFNQSNELFENLLKENINIKYLVDKYCDDVIFELKMIDNKIYLVNAFNNSGIIEYPELVRIAEYFNLCYPISIKSSMFRHGLRMLDAYHNDFFFNTDNMHPFINYFITFAFRNNQYLLYKLSS